MAIGIIQQAIRGTSAVIAFSQAAWTIGKSRLQKKVEIAALLIFGVAQVLGVVFTASRPSFLVSKMASLAAEVTIRSVAAIADIARVALGPQHNRPLTIMSVVPSDIIGAVGGILSSAALFGDDTNVTISLELVGLLVGVASSIIITYEVARNGLRKDQQSLQVIIYKSSPISPSPRSPTDFFIEEEAEDFSDEKREKEENITFTDPAITISESEILRRFKQNPLEFKRIIFKHDPILNQYICPLTKKPIRFIVKVEAYELQKSPWYERRAITEWLELYRHCSGPRLLPGCDQQLVTVSTIKIIADLDFQGVIDDRLKKIADGLEI